MTISLIYDQIISHQIFHNIYEYHFPKKYPEWQVTNVSGVIYFSSGYRLAVSVYPSINFMGMKNDRRPSSLANSFVVLFFNRNGKIDRRVVI